MEITHNQAAKQFQASVPGGLAVLRYRIDRETISLLHVEVPTTARGQGIAAQLTQAALDFAKAQGLHPVPICPYVVAYMRRHPQNAEPLISVPTKRAEAPCRGQ